MSHAGKVEGSISIDTHIGWMMGNATFNIIFVQMIYEQSSGVKINPLGYNSKYEISGYDYEI